MPYKDLAPPAGGKISNQNGKIHVPDNPVLPFIRGDGTGPDVRARAVATDEREHRIVGDVYFSVLIGNFAAGGWSKVFVRHFRIQVLLFQNQEIRRLLNE